MLSVRLVLFSSPTATLQHRTFRKHVLPLAISPVEISCIGCRYRIRHYSTWRESNKDAATSNPQGSDNVADDPGTDLISQKQHLFPTEFSDGIRQGVPSSSVSDFEDEEIEDYAAPEFDPNDDLVNRNKDDGDINTRLDRHLSNFLPSHARRKKLDLSNVNPLKWEGKFQNNHHPATLTFRSSYAGRPARLRTILLDYLRNVELPFHDRIVATNPPDLESEILLALRSTFHHDSLWILESDGYDPTDVASWAWIFSSPNIDHAIARYAALAERLRRSQRGRIPKWVPLQLLRAATISPWALKELIDSILKDLEVCFEAKAYPGWHWSTRVCLIVRLLRHARLVAPGHFNSISAIVKHLFFDLYAVDPLPVEERELRRLTYCFNRFLSLISRTPSKNPFNSYMPQQSAQLSLVRLMVGFKPQLPIIREGYRALIAVQLLHRKTGPERTWAEVKSPSWPPWRRDKSGIEHDLEYPGQESRVAKLLRRMNEAGYAHGEWEKSATILAGWDTDKSPTIQTRAILTLPQRPWLLAWNANNDNGIPSIEGPLLWAARIQATRSKREAWASFCAYEKSNGFSSPHDQPCFAMLEKLLAETVHWDSKLGSRYVAGDLRETFEDSTNPRETVYVEREVPSADEFYHHIIQAGIKPKGNILRSLLDHAPSAVVGFSYIQDSAWSETMKGVLRYAGRYPLATMKDLLNDMSPRTLASFISLLSRSKPDDRLKLETVGQGALVNRKLTKGRLDVSPLTYAWQVLVVANPRDIRVWNDFAKGALIRISNAPVSSADNIAAKIEAWRYLRTLLSDPTFSEVHPDLTTFRHLGGIISMLTRDTRVRMPRETFGSVAKRTFVRAVYGRPITPFLPSTTTPLLDVPEAGDLQLMVRVLVSIQDLDGLLALMKWLNEHASTFQHLNKAPGTHWESLHEPARESRDLPPLRLTLCLIRLFLEGGPLLSSGSSQYDEHDDAWFETPLRATPDMVARAKKYCESFGWPSDEELEVFVSQRADLVRRIARSAEITAIKARAPAQAPVPAPSEAEGEGST